MSFRLKRTHPFSSHPSPEAAIGEDRSLFRSARFAADRGLISRRSFLRAGTGFAAWTLVLESAAFAELRGGRKGYAVQGIVDRDALLGDVVEPEDWGAQDTLGAAWGPLESLADERRTKRPGRLARTDVGFEKDTDRGTRTGIVHGLDDGLTSPLSPQERYRVRGDAEARFGAHEREARELVREIMTAHRQEQISAVDRLERQARPDEVRFAVAVRPAELWCNRVGEVATGSIGTLPAGAVLTYHGRISNSVLVNHPLAYQAAGRGRLATFVDARHLVDLHGMKRLYVHDRRLPEEGFAPQRSCLPRREAETLCDEG